MINKELKIHAVHFSQGILDKFLTSELKESGKLASTY